MRLHVGFGFGNVLLDLRLGLGLVVDGLNPFAG
jgi:hypothetical protein